MDKYSKQLAAIEREMREVLGKARAITTAAADEGRAITSEEDVEIKGFLGSVDVLKEKRKEIEGAIETRKRVEDVGTTMVIEEDEKKSSTPTHRKAQSMGEAFVKSEGFKALQARGLSGSWTTGSVEIEGYGKALLTTTGAGADTSGGDLIVPQYLPGIVETLFERLTVAQLMAQGSTVSNLVSYMKETLATNAAAGVAEAGEKPESSLEFDSATSAVKKIATWLPVTDEMLEDVAQLASYINSRLALFVQIEEEAQLLYGAGGDDLDGLFGQIPANNKGLRSSTANATDADHIFRAISRVRESFLEPDGLVIHPNDWEGIVLSKDDNKNYMGGGPFQSENGNGLWGLRTVVTTAVTEAAPIVGAFGTASQVFRKGGLTVEASNSHSDYFIKNKTAIRAEERLALAVYRGAAFATADLGTAGSAT